MERQPAHAKHLDKDILLVRRYFDLGFTLNDLLPLIVYFLQRLGEFFFKFLQVAFEIFDGIQRLLNICLGFISHPLFG